MGTPAGGWATGVCARVSVYRCVLTCLCGGRCVCIGECVQVCAHEYYVYTGECVQVCAHMWGCVHGCVCVHG